MLLFKVFFSFNIVVLKLWQNIPYVEDSFILNLHRNENVELVPNLFEPHCGYSLKNTQVGTFAQWFILMNIFLELFDIKY